MRSAASTEGEVDATCVQFGSRGKNSTLKGRIPPRNMGHNNHCNVLNSFRMLQSLIAMKPKPRFGETITQLEKPAQGKPSAKYWPTRLVVDAALRRIGKSRHGGHKIANISVNCQRI